MENKDSDIDIDNNKHNTMPEPKINAGQNNIYQAQKDTLIGLIKNDLFSLSEIENFIKSIRTIEFRKCTKCKNLSTKDDYIKNSSFCKNCRKEKRKNDNKRYYQKIKLKKIQSNSEDK